MADVFVSYKAEDRKRVAQLVQALEANGLSVWWDAHIGGGDEWRDTIQRHLDEAKCVIVVWSKRSIGPDAHFVRDEATRAQRRHAYLPLRIDQVEPPLGFGETQAISLVGWSGGRSDRRYQSLLAAARAIISGGPRPVHVHVEKPDVSRRAVMAAGIGAAAAAAAGGWFLLKPEPAGASNSIAVLPFANLSGDLAQAYFSDGMAEELRSALSRIPELKVMARTSSEKVRNDDIRTAARKLDVGSILTGSVRRSATMIRVNAQLISGDNGLERWSEAYDRPAGDALQIQVDIAQKVAAALSVELGRRERAALTAGGTRNPAAQDLFLKASALMSIGDKDSLQKAIGFLDEAIKTDPGFAKAYAKKGRAIRVLTGFFASSATEYEPGFAQADAAAREALKRAPGLQDAYVTLASTRAARLDFRGAHAYYSRANIAASQDVDAMLHYAEFRGYLGRPAEGLELANRAIASDPLNPWPHEVKAWMLFLARRYADAVSATRDLLRWSPGRQYVLYILGSSLLLLGRIAEARAVYAPSVPDANFLIVGRGILAARTGDRAGSDQALSRLWKIGGDAWSYQFAQIHAQRGDKDLAFKALNRAVAIRDPGLIYLPTDPFVDPLRSDPRFHALASRLEYP